MADDLVLDLNPTKDMVLEVIYFDNHIRYADVSLPTIEFLNTYLGVEWGRTVICGMEDGMWRECSVLCLAYICHTPLLSFRTGYGCSRCTGDIEVSDTTTL